MTDGSENIDLVQLGTALALTGLNNELVILTQQAEGSAEQARSWEQRVSDLEALLDQARQQQEEAQTDVAAKQDQLEQKRTAAMTLLTLVAPGLEAVFQENGSLQLPADLAEKVQATLRLLPTAPAAPEEPQPPEPGEKREVPYIVTTLTVFQTALIDLPRAMQCEWNVIAGDALGITDLSSNRNNATFKAIRATYTALLLYRDGILANPSPQLEEVATQLQTEEAWNSFTELMKTWKVNPIDL
jgi:hypothetical protein